MIPTATKRLDRQAALRCLTQVPLGSLMKSAHEQRLRLHPQPRVTYVRDTNPNYTNVCVTGCRFCAFHKNPGHPEGYTLTPGELLDRIAPAIQRGATTVLLQGGHHPDMRLDDWLDYIQAIQSTHPGLHIHPFSPPEIAYMAEKENTRIENILEALYRAGIRTLPGGGAEVLIDRVRTILSPQKCSAATWLSVMEKAHLIGFRTTATLMFGHIETDAEIIEHLFLLRDLQDRTRGFNSFIPWSYKPGRTELGSRVTHAVHPALYLRVIATARLVLDNFDHIQSSWFSENPAAGQLGLNAGADDFGGILFEENVLKETGFAPTGTEHTVRNLILKAGFSPAVRDSNYCIAE